MAETYLTEDDALDGLVEFADESPNIAPSNENAPWKVMIVDDEEAIHTVTLSVLENYSFEERALLYLHAYSGAQAIQLCQEHPDIALIILDVVMENDSAGLEVVRHVRSVLKNLFVRIILYTGQPGQAPESSVIRDYDINDYKVKSLLTSQGLYTAVMSAIRSYRDLRLIEEQRATLQQALQDAQIAHKARYQFLANIGHELRTPLNHILGFSEMLLHTRLNERQRRYIETIKKAGEGLTTVLKNILDLTESIEGGVALQEYPYSLRSLVADFMKIMEVQAQWKNLTAAYEIADDVPDALFGDSRRIQQMLMNLFSNALKFTKQGTVTLRISRLDAQPDMLLFAVQDTGVGIAKAMQSNIFQPFGLGEDTLKKEFSGAGLGLAITKDFVEKMRGRIWFESEAGQGSTFYVALPVKTL